MQRKEQTMNEKTKRISRLISALITGGLALATLIVFRSVPARAWNTGGQVPSPCDFTTGGGFIFTNSAFDFNGATLPEGGQKANFGLVGGCKNGGFFGHVNYVDHANGLHVSSDTITGYVDPCPGCSPPAANNARDICGTAEVTDPSTGQNFGTHNFRVRTIDAEKQSSFPQPKDKFGIELQNQSGDIDYFVPVRCLADNTPTGDVRTCSPNVGPGGGDIQLHKPAPPNTTGPSSAVCPDDAGLGY
jgi:hypothetical protein